MTRELIGVNQGPFGSEARKQGIDNSNSDELFSTRGLEVLKTVLASYRDAGATIGGAPTFRLTDFRISDERDWR